MAKQSGLSQNLYVGGYDVSGDVGALNRVASPRSLLVVTGIDKAALERINGQADGEISFNVWFDDAALAEHAALKTLPTADVQVLYAMGLVLSSPAAGLVSKQVNYDWQRGPDGSLQGTVQCLGASGVPLEWCKMLTAGKVTVAAAGNTTGEVDAQTTAGLAAYLQIFSVGSGTPTVKIQDSSDTTNGIDGAWSDLITFTITAQGAERKTVAGTVKKGLRVNLSGVFTDCVLAVCFRRGLAADDVAYA